MIQVASFGYVICAAAFMVVTGLLAISRTESRYKTVLLIASALTAMWAATTFARMIVDGDARLLSSAINLLEYARTLGWIAATAFVIFFAYGKRFERLFAAFLGGGIGLSIIYLVGMDAYGLLTSGQADPELVRLVYIARVILAVSGLLLVENLFRNSGTEARWAVKTLCFGIGTILAYDFLLYAEAALFGRISSELFTARGLVDTLAAPLIVLAAARSRKWPIDLHVSRTLVFHSATLLGAGGYLVVISGASYYFTSSEGPWSESIRIVIIAAGALILALVLTSAAIQARIKEFITKNFFSYKYDYRSEWLKFIDAASTSSAQLGIPDRIIRAIASIVESTDGAMWVYRDEDHAYQPAANWNMGEVLPSFSADDPFVTELRASGAVFNLMTLERDGQPSQGVGAAPPEWLARHARAWLVLPLPHRDQMPAFAVLGRRRVAGALTWEDYALLKTVARQSASYVAEELSGISLARARRFEDFNRQFAFVVHDLKNLAGQMTLILKNADRHGDNPEFQKDVLATIRDSVERMHLMLQQLRDGRQRAGQKTTADLARVIERMSAGWRLRSPTIDVVCPAGGVSVSAGAETIEAIANHLVQNAIDASGGKPVTVRVVPPQLGGGFAVLSIADQGPGMDQQFVEERLFQPLESTKATGYGIGAFQARQLARDVGGRLTVQSAPGRGTTMIVELPLADRSDTTGAGERNNVVVAGHG